MKPAAIYDTNVSIVANNNDGANNLECVFACRNILIKAKEKITVIDDRQLILNEYKRYLNFSGQPGLGDVFFKWLWSVQADTKHCEKVHLEVRRYGPDQIPIDFQLLPEDDTLSTFDPSDKKFVAVALGSRYSPVIYNATDSDWWENHNELNRLGVRVENLCGDSTTA